MRVVLIGAFPFPFPQGSQVFAAGQARALVQAGAQVALACYGRGAGTSPAAVERLRTPRAVSPRRMRSGPTPGKLLADPALVATVLRAHRRARFDVALAHNAEAALVADAARALGGPPFVYVAHTLLAEELDAYLPRAWSTAARRAGRRIDRFAAARADAVLTLCEFASDALAPWARGPVECIAPGHDDALPDDPAGVARICAEHRLALRGFSLYTGNLDGYQDLALLAEAARRLPEGAPPLVVATHDRERAVPPPLRAVRVGRAAQARALTRAAQALVLPRRRRGGFPIKLLNYMEAERPIVAFREVACGLVNERDALLPRREEGAAGLARSLTRLGADEALGETLARAARARLARHHDWPRIARRTLDLCARVSGCD